MTLARRWAFARHIPPRQIAARLWLDARRRIAERTRPRLAVPEVEVTANPPLPLFAPRTGKIEQLPGGWHFTFLNRSIAMGATIDWSAPGPGPEHQLWRMNLHYMEYLESVGADAGITLIEQWSAANPPFTRGYWRDSWNSYALSLRVVVWMQWLAREGLAPPAVLHSLTAQLRFLERNLETDLGGNHLVKNIKALLWGSAFFSGSAAVRWRRKGLKLLERELRRQILSDGVHYERSPSYHAQVFADLLEIRHMLGEDRLDGRLDRALDAMAAPISALAHPDGGPALFNDAGLSMAYAPVECMNAYRRVTGRAVMRAARFVFAEAGYYGVRTPTFYLVADMGRIGPDQLPAHAHGDIGSFELSVGGARMIVDQGVFEYIAGERRTASRAAASHNTLAVDGGDQAEFFGAFRCGRRPDVTVQRHSAEDGRFLLEGTHDGFARLPGNPIAYRRFEVEGNRVTITDRLIGSSCPSARVGLLLHPECAVVVDGVTATIARDAARLTIRASQPLAIEPAVWWPDMGVERATKRLCLTLPATCFETALELSAAIEPAPEPK